MSGQEFQFSGWLPPVTMEQAPVVDDRVRRVMFGHSADTPEDRLPDPELVSALVTQIDEYCRVTMPEPEEDGSRERWLDRPDGGTLILVSNEDAKVVPPQGDPRDGRVAVLGLSAYQARLWRRGLPPGRYRFIENLYVDQLYHRAKLHVYMRSLRVLGQHVEVKGERLAEKAVLTGASDQLAKLVSAEDARRRGGG